MNSLIKRRQQRLHILVICHPLHIWVSTCNFNLMQNRFSLFLERDYCASSTSGIGWNINMLILLILVWQVPFSSMVLLCSALHICPKLRDKRNHEHLLLYLERNLKFEWVLASCAISGASRIWCLHSGRECGPRSSGLQLAPPPLPPRGYLHASVAWWI